MEKIIDKSWKIAKATALRGSPQMNGTTLILQQIRLLCVCVLHLNSFEHFSVYISHKK